MDLVLRIHNLKEDSIYTMSYGGMLEIAFLLFIDPITFFT